MAGKIAPVPPALVALGQGVGRWFQSLADRAKPATTGELGTVKKAAAVADLNQTISNPPTQSEVQAISDKVDDLLSKLRTSGALDS